MKIGTRCPRYWDFLLAKASPLDCCSSGSFSLLQLISLVSLLLLLPVSPLLPVSLLLTFISCSFLSVQRDTNEALSVHSELNKHKTDTTCSQTVADWGPSLTFLRSWRWGRRWERLSGAGSGDGAPGWCWLEPDAGPKTASSLWHGEEKESSVRKLIWKIFHISTVYDKEETKTKNKQTQTGD